jgi:phospholipase D1/2
LSARPTGIQRFRLYTPVTSGGKPIYVHAKVMVVDDRLLEVGSSNLNNRSLGFDTECDLSVDAMPSAPDADALSRSIIGLRNDLVAEHLGVPNGVVEKQIQAEDGSLMRAIDALRSSGRSLRPFEAPDINDIEASILDENQLLDPERPAGRWRALRHGLRLRSP